MMTANYSAANLHAIARIQRNYEKYKGLLENMYNAASQGKFYYQALWPLDGDLIDWLGELGFRISAENDYGKTISLRNQYDKEPGYTKYTIRW